MLLAGLQREIELEDWEVDYRKDEDQDGYYFETKEEWDKLHEQYFGGDRRPVVHHHVDINGFILELPDRTVELNYIINEEAYKARDADSQDGGGGYTGNQIAPLDKEYRATVKMILHILYDFEANS